MSGAKHNEGVYGFSLDRIGDTHYCGLQHCWVLHEHILDFKRPESGIPP